MHVCVCHDLDLSGTRDVIGRVTIRFPISHFVLVVRWNQASISNSFWDIQWQMSRNDWHDLKRPLNKGQGHSNLFLMYDFLKAVNNNFCSKRHYSVSDYVLLTHRCKVACEAMNSKFQQISMLNELTNTARMHAALQLQRRENVNKPSLFTFS